MDSLWQDALEIILTSLFLVTIYCVLIIIASRYGWFLWLFKKILQLRSNYAQQKENLAADKSPEEDAQ